MHPNLVNATTRSATLTVDLRNTDQASLKRAEQHLHEEIKRICDAEQLDSVVRTLTRFEPV